MENQRTVLYLQVSSYRLEGLRAGLAGMGSGGYGEGTEQAGGMPA